MDFNYFLKNIPKLIATKLPESEAHLKMTPLLRLKKPVAIENSKKAAVLMLIYPKCDKAHLVLIFRNAYKGVHSAQISFPGGKYEQEDLDFATTAVRETHEEIGVHPDKIKIIRPFSEVYIEPSNFMVYPFLGICNEEINFIPDPSEVADIIEIALSTFINEVIITKSMVTPSYAQPTEVPAFTIKGHIVWGATAMILNELKEVLKIIEKA